MKARLFTLAAAVSLLLCLASAMLWARSYWVADWIMRWSVRDNDDPWKAFLVSESGTILYMSQRTVPPAVPTGWKYFHDSSSGPSATVLKYEWNDAQSVLLIPHWLLAGSFAVAPVWWIFSPGRRRAKRD